MLEDFLDIIRFEVNDSNVDTGEDIEGQWMDMDNDGVNEPFLADVDGVFDIMAADADGDGIFDNFEDISGGFEDSMVEMDAEIYAEDTNGDDIADTVNTETTIDSDNDFRPDYYSVTEEVDVNGNGVADFIIFSEDINGDPVFDAVTQWDDPDGEENWEEVCSDGMELADAEAYNVYDHFEPENSDGNGIIGDPGDAMESWHVQSGNTCAVVSQEFALESIFDREFDEDELRELAEDNGWYNNGTSMEDVGKIMEYYGVNVEQSIGNSLDDLKESLAEGNQVIVGVDADELWSGQNEEMFGPGMDADHAIQVIGFDESDMANPMVIINDSGVANGQGVMVPAEEFLDAWEDSGCFMVEAY